MMAWKQSLVLALAFVALASAAPGWKVPGFGKSDKGLKPGFYSADGEFLAENDLPVDQSVVLGDVDGDYSLLMKETVWKETIWGVSRDKDIVYPKKHEEGQKISGIKIIDQRLDGKNGKIRVKKGGVGDDEVKLRFDSQRGRDLSYIVEIYGRVAASSEESVEAPAKIVSKESSSSSSEEAPKSIEVVDRSEESNEVEPIVEEPVEVEPVAEEPIREEPVAEEPVEDEPVAEEPVEDEPVAEEPVEDEPIVEEPVEVEPVAEEPIPEEPVEDEPIIEEPVEDEPIIEEPVEVERISKESVEDKPSAEEPVEVEVNVEV